jgi:hypothetical protein
MKPEQLEIERLRKLLVSHPWTVDLSSGDSEQCGSGIAVMVDFSSTLKPRKHS